MVHREGTGKRRGVCKIQFPDYRDSGFQTGTRLACTWDIREMTGRTRDDGVAPPALEGAGAVVATRSPARRTAARKVVGAVAMARERKGVPR